MLHKIAICDDDPLFLSAVVERIKSYLAHVQIKAELSEFTSGELFLAAIRQSTYDLVILDIELSRINGLQISKHLRAITSDTSIIYLSSHANYVFESFQYNPLRFIRKEYWELEIEEALNAYLKSYLIRHPVYLFQSASEYISVPISDIVYLEVYNHNVTIHLTNQVLTIRRPLNRLEEELRPYGFIRIHQSFLVSYRYIYAILSVQIVLTDQSRLPISRGKTQWVKDQLAYYLRK